MLYLAISLFALLVVLALAQAPFVIGMAREFKDCERELLPDGDCPKTALLLCLRGNDPFLKDCIQGLVTQDYPNYDIFIIVDHAEDPARQTVDEFLAAREEQAPQVNVQILTDRLGTCSLVNSSMIQVISGLDESYEIVAGLDADVIAYPSWLRELVTPLASEDVGAATGHRWYMPRVATWGSLVRYIWNAATTASICHTTVWGGSLAMKRKCIQESGMLDRWRTAFAFDLIIYQEIVKLGKQVAFVPSVMMINRETCDLPGFFRWLQRQLLLGRLYQPVWPMILGHGIATGLALAAAIVGSVVALATSQIPIAIWMIGGLLVYLVTMIVLLAMMESTVRRVVAQRGESTDWLSFGRLIKCLFAMPVTQVVYLASLAKAQFLRSVEWRRMHYKIHGPQNIEVGEYQPYEPAAENAGSLTSL